MKKLLTIIILIILVASLLIGGMWFLKRKTAVKNGTTPPSFRDFLNFKTKENPANNPDSGLSSDFTPDETPTLPPETTPNGGVVTSSQFTSGPLTPTQSMNNSSSNTGSLKPENGDGNTSTTKPKPATGSSSGTSGGTATTTASSTQQCSDADVMIEFTPEEIAKLSALQNRFYAVAGALHTDQDVKTELANYDEFKAKSDQINELYNYCAATAPQIQNPLFQNRITTPYWRDPARDGEGYYIHSLSPGTGIFSIIQLGSDVYDPRDITRTQSLMERIFRVSLW